MSNTEAVGGKLSVLNSRITFLLTARKDFGLIGLAGMYNFSPGTTRSVSEVLECGMSGTAPLLSGALRHRHHWNPLADSRVIARSNTEDEGLI